MVYMRYKILAQQWTSSQACFLADGNQSGHPIENYTAYCNTWNLFVLYFEPQPLQNKVNLQSKQESFGFQVHITVFPHLPKNHQAHPRFYSGIVHLRPNCLGWVAPLNLFPCISPRWSETLHCRGSARPYRHTHVLWPKKGWGRSFQHKK